jgi:hypothetical protein
LVQFELVCEILSSKLGLSVAPIGFHFRSADSVAVVATELRAVLPCGARALPVSPRRERMRTMKAESPPHPHSTSPFSPPPCHLHHARAEAERSDRRRHRKSTAAEHHHLIPRSHRRTMSSSTSLTTPHDRLTSGRACQACASTAVAIVAAKPSSRVAVFVGAPTASPLRCSVSASMC